MLNMFENMLRSIANDQILMSYGNNYNAVNGLLSVSMLIQNLKMTVQNDRTNDMFAMNMMNKIAELENIVVTLGNQRLMACGINPNAMKGTPPMSPLMANTPMYNQQMFYPNMMYMNGPQMMQQSMYGQPMAQHQPVPFAQPTAPPMFQAEQPPVASPIAPQFSQMPAAQTAATQVPPQPTQTTPAQAATVQAPINQQAVQSAPPSSSNGGFDFAFPGTPNKAGGGGDKASGRDYLLKLLSEK